MTYSPQIENKGDIALAFCPIFPTIRFGSLHDLVKKIAFITIEEGYAVFLELFPIRPPLS